MDTSMPSVFGSLPYSNNTFTQPQTNGESIHDADDQNLDDLTLIQAIRRARNKRIEETGSALSGKPRKRLTSVFAATDCEFWKLRKKAEKPTLGPSSANLTTTTLPNGFSDSSQRPASSKPASCQSSSRGPSSNAIQRPAPHVQHTQPKPPPKPLIAGAEKDDRDLPSQQPNKRSLPGSKHPSARGNTPNYNGANVPTPQLKGCDGKASLGTKRSRRSLSLETNTSPTPNRLPKRPRTKTTASSSARVPNTSSPQQSLRPGPEAKQPAQHYYNEEEAAPISKTRIRNGGLAQADIDLLNHFKAQHPTTQPAEVIPWQSINPKTVRKASQNAPSKEEHARSKYRARARDIRREQIESNIVQNQRKEHPDKSAESIRKEAAVRVGAWERDRQAVDKRQKQLENNVAKVQKHRAVTNLSVKPSEFLNPARLATVYTILRCDPFEGELEGQELAGKLFRDGTYTTVEKANEAAFAILKGGPATSGVWRDIRTDILWEEGGVFQGSAKQPDGKKLFCMVKKEYQQVGELPLELTQGKKLREGALKTYQKRFDVWSMCVRPQSAQPTTNPNEDVGNSKGMFLSSPDSQQEREVSVGSVATATFPEGSANPAGNVDYVSHCHGAYTDRAWANREAFKLMRELWYPRGARMDAHLHYRDILKPSIDGLEQQGDWDIHNIEFNFNPKLHDKVYDFISSKV